MGITDNNTDNMNNEHAISTLNTEKYKNVVEVFKAKDPTFVENYRVEGNMAVLPHPNTSERQYFGDGSVEVSGTVFTDKIQSATPVTVIHIGSPFSFHSQLPSNSNPVPGQVFLYSDETSKDRLVMVDADGNKTDVNPLVRIGDLMTYNALKETTDRLPVGLPGHHLSVSPSEAFSRSIQWQADYSNVYQPIENTDENVRYFQAYATAQMQLSTTPSLVTFDTPLRQDSNCFSIGNGTLHIFEPGFYEVFVNVGVSFIENVVSLDNESTDNYTTSAEIYLEMSDPGGFSLVTGSNSCKTMIRHSFENSHNVISTCAVINVPENGVLKVFVKEISSVGANSGNLELCRGKSSVAIRKIIFGDSSTDRCQFLAVNASADINRQISYGIPFEFATGTINLKTNPADTVYGNSVKVAEEGTRIIYAKITSAFSGANLDATASVRLRINVNDYPIDNGVAYAGLSGPNGQASTFVYTIINLNANDIITAVVDILNNSSTTGTVQLISSGCSLQLSRIKALGNYVNLWKQYHSTGQDAVNTALTSDKFNFVDIPTIFESDTTTYSSIPDGMQVHEKGTFTVTYQTTVQNLGNDPETAVFCLFADVGEGYKEVKTSLCYVTIAGKNCAQSVLNTSIVYLPSFGRLSVRALSANGGNMQILAATSQLIVSKMENTLTPFIGMNNFGEENVYVSSNEEQSVVSTEFVTRLQTTSKSLPEGTYRMSLTFEWDMSDGGIGFETRLMVDGGIVDTFSQIPISVGNYQKTCLFKHVELTQGFHTMSFETRVLDESRSFSTRNVRMELWRIK